MSRDVPFDPEAVCDGCGRRGSFDFVGDFFCQDCISADVIDECICESLTLDLPKIPPNTVRLTDPSKYVKELRAGGWEIKLGAGILPFVLTQRDYDYFSDHENFVGTSAPPSWMNLEDFCRKANGYVAVKQNQNEHAR